MAIFTRPRAWETQKLAWALAGNALAACNGEVGGGDPYSGALDAGSDLDADAQVEAAPGDATLDPTPPSLIAAEVRQVGRFGDDLRIEVSGGDPDSEITALEVQLFDDAQSPIGGPRVVGLAAPIPSGQGSASAVLSRGFDAPGAIERAQVALVNAQEARSASRAVEVGRQPELGEGAACDVRFVQNRCGAGLGCKGDEATASCRAGEAPVLSKVGYFEDRELGPRILMEGRDPDADVVSYTLVFFDAAGAPVSLDLDSDPRTAPVGTFTGAVATAQEASFFYRFEPNGAFLEQVKQIEIQVTDGGERTSNTLSAPLGDAPARGADEACDPRGFDRCAAGVGAAALVCATRGGSSRCTGLVAARAEACAQAAVLNPALGASSLLGAIQEPSLWDAPEGCSFGQTNLADGVVKLVLGRAASKVVLSTDFSHTAFDSELYLLASCESAPSLYDPQSGAFDAPWCEADQATGNPKAVLELRDLTAGEYFVVVESYPSAEATGSGFQLSVTVE